MRVLANAVFLYDKKNDSRLPELVHLQPEILRADRRDRYSAECERESGSMDRWQPSPYRVAHWWLRMFDLGTG